MVKGLTEKMDEIIDFKKRPLKEEKRYDKIQKRKRKDKKVSCMRQEEETLRRLWMGSHLFVQRIIFLCRKSILFFFWNSNSEIQVGFQFYATTTPLNNTVRILGSSEISTVINKEAKCFKANNSEHENSK